MINKVTPRKRNSETDKRLVAPDQYTDAINIRVENSFSESGENASGNVGVVKPVRGNEVANISLEDNMVGYDILGRVLDVPTNCLYFAAANPNANLNGVFKVDPSTSEISPIVQTNYFGWSAGPLGEGLPHVDMCLARDKNDNVIIYMTDGVNAPYKVDVNFHQDNSTISGEQLYDAITVCQLTPHQPISAQFTSSASGKPSNFKRINGVQFAYQNIYETGEISAVSSYSKLLVPPPYLEQGAGDLSQLDAYDTIEITIPAQPSSVESVRLLVRFGESDPFYVIDELASNGSAITKSFDNDEVLNTLPEKESNRLYDAVPIKALTNEIQEDRLFYGNYTEGRYNTLTADNTATTTATLTVEYAERPNDFKSLAIDVEPMVLRLDKDDGLLTKVGISEGSDESYYCKNRIAGFRVKLQGGVDETIEAGSIFSFDLTFQPDKNWHLYESSSSFHGNNELYGFNPSDADHKFASNFNYKYLSSQSNFGSGSVNLDAGNTTATNAEFYWPRSAYGFPGVSPSNGSLNNAPRRALSDVLFADEEPAKWIPKTGPYKNQAMECIYGASPASPVILRGGDIYFSVRFKTNVDMSASEAVKKLAEILSESSGIDPEIEVLREITRGGYQIDLGVGADAKKRFSRTDSFSDLVCQVGLKNIYGAGDDTYLDDNILGGGDMKPCGFFAVNKADLEFRLRDLSSVPPHTSTFLSEGSDSDSDSYFLAIDLSSIKNVELVTCVPVFEHETSGFDWFNAFDYRPFSNENNLDLKASLRYAVAYGFDGNNEETNYINFVREYQIDGEPTLGNGVWQGNATQTKLVGEDVSNDALHVLSHNTTVHGWVAHGVNIQTPQDFRLTESEAKNLFYSLYIPAADNSIGSIYNAASGATTTIANVYHLMANWGLNEFSATNILAEGNGVGALQELADSNTLNAISPMTMWFGRLSTPGTPAGSGGDDGNGNDGQSGGARLSIKLPYEENPLFRTFDDYVAKLNANNEFQDNQDTPLTSPQAFVNFSSSMVDGEGGIGGWKGSLSATANQYAGVSRNGAFFNPGVGESEWNDLYQSYLSQGLDGYEQPELSFTTEEVDEAFRRFTGKIEGSVPSSIVINGTWGVGVRIVVDTYLKDTGSGYLSPLGDNSNGDLEFFLATVYAAQSDSSFFSRYSEQPFYPPDKAFGGPTLLGFHFPFQYLFPGILRPNTRMSSTIDNCELLGKPNGTDQDLAPIVNSVIQGYSQLGSYDIDNGVSRLVSTAPGYLTINSDASLQDERPSAVEILSENTFVVQGNEFESSYKSFKRYANHNLGILYYDYFGRPGSVLPFDPVYVGGYGQDVNNGKTSIKVTFDTEAPPDWAHSYRFVYGGNSSISDFIQYTAGGAFIGYQAFDGTTEETEANIYVSLNYLQENSDVSYTKAFGAVSNANEDFLYRYSPGDKLRIISYFDGDDIDTRQFPVNYEFDILDVVTLDDNSQNPIHNPNDGTVPKFKRGQFLVLKNNPLASGFTYGSVKAGGNAESTQSHRWNNRAVVEIYTPRALRDSDEILYREIGPSYDLYDSGGGAAVHAAASHVVTDGDVWFRSAALNMPAFQGNKFANIIKGSTGSNPRFRDYYVESFRFTDSFPNTRVSGKGKPFIYSPDARQLNKSSSIIFSDINARSSKYNRFSTFDATTANFKNIPNDHGSIQMIIKDGDSLAAFQESKMSMLPVNRSVLSDASNSATLLASSQTIGNQVFVPGNYGVGTNPESVLYVDGFIYFANPKRGELYRYAPSRGVEVISDSGMKDYFNNLFANVNESSKVVSGFDYKNSEYLMDFLEYTDAIAYNKGQEPVEPSLPAAPAARSSKSMIGQPLVVTRKPKTVKPANYNTKSTSVKPISAATRKALNKLAGRLLPSARRSNRSY